MLNCAAARPAGMALERTRSCPSCGAETTFYRRASTNLHLGLKAKWVCADCGYGFVEIDGIVSDATDG